MAITEAPFDHEGNMVSYPDDLVGWERYTDDDGNERHRAIRPTMLPVEPFYDEFEIVGIELGRSAKRLVLKSRHTGKTYPLFVADIVKLLQDNGTVLKGTWGVAKRGQNYGIKQIEPPQVDKYKPLLGKQVKVTLDNDDPKAIATGTLLSFSDDGEVVVQDEMGFVHYCWPNLKMEEI
ncbi:hypothetical protein SEA_DIMINIMUS_130 [Mycobacterium phage Diminimus]|nr:hypothetical protein [Mycobacterium phage SirSheldon]WNN95689.1 hypothetical protein SEA_GLASKE16_132 [Mycobacterium phage Glaske16]WNN96259.1 hypothetical protein SEA_DULCITA_130 [Mycobacterium phage Dulcita]WNO28203.1 hypothetical protein SEA_DIMINIMUS_130 [Mycobacterium phage Diminimus]